MLGAFAYCNHDDYRTDPDDDPKGCKKAAHPVAEYVSKTCMDKLN
jgi:hypothetical protein